MAPKVRVPMNFGRHHLNSLTHSNLTLNLMDGKKSQANSLILSFNSPVIERLVATLDITSLDMEDFQESSVECFVDCLYTGDIEMMDRNSFRDVNKMAEVFEVTWLTGKCSGYFEDLVDVMSISDEDDEDELYSYCYEDMLYWFEEASYAYINLKQRDLINFVLQKICSVDESKALFLARYLEDVTDLPTNKLDLVVKLAGKDLGIVVQSFTTKLRSHVSEQGALLPDIFRHFLDTADLRICRTYNKVAFEELFDLLQDKTSSTDELRWILSQYRKSCDDSKEVSTLPFQFERDAPAIEIEFPVHLHETIERTSSCSLDYFILELLANEDVADMLTFSEAIWRYVDLHPYYKVGYFESELPRIVRLVKNIRGWNPLPTFAVNYYQLDTHPKSTISKFLKECGAFDDKLGYFDAACITNRAKISCHGNFPQIFELTLENGVLGCKIKGRCGLMLRTDPIAAENTSIVDLLERIKLCTDNREYPDDLHIHRDVIRAWEDWDLHFFLSDKGSNIYPVTPALCPKHRKLYRKFRGMFEDLNKFCYLQAVYGL